MPPVRLFAERPEHFSKQFFFTHALFHPGLQILETVGGGVSSLLVGILVLEVKGFEDGLLSFIQFEDLGNELEISAKEIRVHVFGDPGRRPDLSVGRGDRKDNGKQRDDQLAWIHSEPHVVRLNEQNRL